ncbi:helix-turn-helix domain-containing protein [Clostridium sp. MD294]|uniref:helix-turn-helix domain-containing protein n=1 Tax=Clostridium sp. MD294 TaxID=97138 RepID=UPI0002C995CB|nr:helix-turn-helix domain-containing protein [Clostridium sp. MD294]NDO45985.1 helix-turn-helix domain-containing protein [Clostridium sp. MD294]USF30354.1 hypothetical protein C820_001795 [Clostridium sp. MD294]
MEKKQQAYEDWRRGMKYKEIAEKYDISLSTVKSWAVRYWKQEKGEKVATTTAKKLQTEKKKGGAPKGNKNHVKHGIYERMLFEFLSEQEQQFFLQHEIDEIEECKNMIKFCDLQILKFMRKIKELEQKAGGLVVSGVSKKKRIEDLQKENTNVQQEITTNTVAVHELILRYNNEIEKAKKQKMKCLEVLLKFGETQNKQQTEQTTAVNIYLPDNGRV